jgi:hypothetical protein
MRIVASVNREAVESVVRALGQIGIVSGELAAGRSITLEHRQWLGGLWEQTVMVDTPLEIVRFLVSPALEERALDIIIKTARLDMTGRGSVSSEGVELLRAHPLCDENTAEGATRAGERLVLGALRGICCIVQRGQGELLARVALDTGTCVPAITYGVGTGVRDKLGLLRIAISADKELITLAAGVEDADGLMDLLIDRGKLEQPGKGFIYQYPLSRGLMDRGISRGKARHGASMEQIIATLDELKGSAQWRSRSGGGTPEARAPRKYLCDLTDLSLVCDEGRGEELVKAAMAVGAPGATISKLRQLRLQQGSAGSVSLARESCSMIVMQQQVASIVQALDKAGAFDDATHGVLYGRAVPRACTYLGK